MFKKADRMKIWFAACIPEGSAGGVARSISELSSELSRQGHECRIIDAQDSPGNYLAFAVWLVLLFVSQINKRPDWIIGRSTDAVACAVVARLFRLKTRTALHSHGWEENVHKTEQRLPSAFVTPKTTWKARAARFPLLRLMLACCDVCICGTIDEARSLRVRYPNRAKKIVCVPNGVMVRERQFWSWKPVPEAKFLTVGSMTWKKNIRHTVKVIAAVRKTIPSTTLTVVGCSEQELFRETGASRRDGVTAVAHEAPQRMASLYGTCPFYISSSLYEGGRSLAVLEAMSFGCVVFVSSIPSSVEFIRNQANGILLPTLHADEDAARIVTAIRSPALCASVGRKAFLFASRQSWRRQAGRLEKVLCAKR
jgi:glycosyltransferase involved in cell wall biosynthesis